MGDIEQRSWKGVGEHKDNVKGPRLVPCPAPCHGVMGGVHSEPAPPSLESWRRQPRYSVGAGLAGEVGWLRHGERKGQRLGVQLGGWLEVFSEEAALLPWQPGRWV